MFAKAHCDSGRTKSQLCEDLKGRVAGLMSDVARLLQDSAKAELELRRGHGWDIFGSGHELDGVFEGVSLEGARGFQAKHNLLNGKSESQCNA